MICNNILLITILNKPKLILLLLNGLKQKGSYRGVPLRPEWTWEWCQWRGTLDSPNFQDWSLTIRVFKVIYRTVVVGGGNTLPQRCSRSILQPQPTGPTRTLVVSGGDLTPLPTRFWSREKGFKIESRSVIRELLFDNKFRFIDWLSLTACQTV